jgi:hypothetical protein
LIGHQMTKLSDRTVANLDVVLDDACRELPNNGGDHDTRKFVAVRLLRAAQRGKTTLGALQTVARNAKRRLARS